MSTGIDAEIGIVGAGFSGLALAVDLIRRGRSDFLLLEQARAPGGVWRDNVYPGCCCDVPSALYCLEARPNAEWSVTHAAQGEIQDYLMRTVQDEGLASHIRLQTEVRELRFDTNDQAWLVEERNGLHWKFGTVILAIGPHSRAKLPEIPGTETFQGLQFHSSAWPSGFMPQGLRVAVVGTGASAVQIVPTLVGRAASVAVFQRNATWVLPRGGRRIGRIERQLLAGVPWLGHAKRAGQYWLLELAGLGVIGNKTVAAALTRIARRHLERSVSDPVLRAQLTPRHRIGCKRILLSDDYYPALANPSFALIDQPIAAVEETGLRTGDGRLHVADLIVWATGFNVADPVGLPRIIGREGRELSAEWRTSGMASYRGVHVSGYPNLAILLGPGSGPPNGSVLHVAETQVRHLRSWFEAVGRGERRVALDVRSEAQRAWNVEVQRRLRSTAWNSGCTSWYLDSQGRNTTMFPGLSSEYRRLLSRFDTDAFRSDGGMGAHDRI